MSIARSPARPAILALLASLLAAPTIRAERPVRLSNHNLSMSGPGRVRAASEPEICIFCHGVHDTAPDAPLWNRFSSGAIYTPYHSTTAKARIGQPTGSSKLCLSCHDGTVALGQVRKRKSEVRMLSGSSRMPGTRANLGTDLSDDHPISFTYDHGLVKQSDGELRDPSTLRREVRLDNNRQLQCTTCHDPHDDSFGNFLVMDNRRSALCVECHDKRSWSESSHRNSTARWDGSGTDPWPYTDPSSVAEGACENCHTSHKAGTPQRLLLFPREEDNCLSCHDGHVAKHDLGAELNKFSRHDVRATSGVHDPTEDLVNSRRHVECADCHNPHASRPDPAKAPAAGGALAGVPGVNGSGAEVAAVSREFELCFRCHADSGDKGDAYVKRDRPETNTRLEFNTANASFHPVEGPGRNRDVPSLRAPWSSASVLYCTDCHNNDQGPNAGGRGPRGPHGSSYAPILERRLEMRDFRPESDGAYALCYKCHERDSILGDESFAFHRRHVVDEQAACTTCHDSHGVPSSSHLINFNRTYVSAGDGGRLTWTDGGRYRGTCTLTCHGAHHEDLGYDAAAPGGLMPAAGAKQTQRKN